MSPAELDAIRQRLDALADRDDIARVADAVTVDEVRALLAEVGRLWAGGIDGSHAFPNCVLCGVAVHEPESSELCPSAERIARAALEGAGDAA